MRLVHDLELRPFWSCAPKVKDFWTEKILTNALNSLECAAMGDVKTASEVITADATRDTL